MNGSRQFLLRRLVHQVKVPAVATAGVTLLSLSAVLEDDISMKEESSCDSGARAPVSSYTKFTNEFKIAVQNLMTPSVVRCEAESASMSTAEKLDDLRKDAAEFVKSLKDGQVSMDNLQHHPKSLNAFFKAMENDSSALSYDEAVEEYNHDDDGDSENVEDTSSMIATAPSDCKTPYVKTKK